MLSQVYFVVKTFCISELRKKLKFFPGNDAITNEMLKNSSRKFIIALTYVLNAFIE